MVVMVYIANTTYTNLLAHDTEFQEALGDSENATEIIQETFGKVPNSYTALKWISVMLIVGLALSILISSFLVRTNPIFFVPYIIIVVLATIISVPISNAYETIYNNAYLHSTMTGFFGTTWIFLNLPMWVIVIGMLSGILMFINVARTYQYG